jgi:hypothetical protein
MRGLLAALASVIVLAAVGCSNEAKPDENDPWTVVNSYIDAVNASDRGAIEKLVDPAYDATAEIDSRLQRLGDHDLHYETLQFRGTGMADLTSAELTLRSQSGSDTYRDSLSLARSKGRWYLVLGSHR